MENRGLNRIIDIIPIVECSRNLPASCLSSVKEAISSMAEQAGYAGWTYAQASSVNQDPQPNVFFSTYSQEWITQYYLNEYQEIDPVARCSVPGTDIFKRYATWQECYNAALSSPVGDNGRQRTAYIKNVKEFIDHADSFGYRSGILMSKSFGYGLQRLTCTAASEVTPAIHDKQANEHLWRSLSAALTLVFEAVQATAGCGSCGLLMEHFSPSDAEVRWLRSALRFPGYSNEQHAAAAGLSINTFNKQVNNVRTGLDLPGASLLVLALYAEQKGLLH